ncbi:hypothetical protein [Pseudomonas sp. TE3610]
MRLRTIESALVDRLGCATGEKRRDAVRVACELALQIASVDALPIGALVAQLTAGTKFTPEQLAGLRGLIDALDGNYFSSQEVGDENSDSAAVATFSQARAISALFYAGGVQTFTAITEAIYEAGLAVDDPQYVFDAVRAALSEPYAL